MMKKIFVFGFLVFMLSCANNDNDTTADTKADSTGVDGTSQTVADSAQAGNNAAGLSGIMNKMMQDMQGMQMTQDADHDFAMMMKSHHQGAIDMANYEISNGKNEELKTVAGKIVSDAQKDISELQTFLGSHQPSGKSDFAKKAMDMMMKGSSDMNMDHGGDVDQQFSMMMVMHHQHGIDMSKLYLKSAKEEATKKVASNTIKTNGEDIPKLKIMQGATSMEGMDHSKMDMSGDKGKSKDNSRHSGH